MSEAHGMITGSNQTSNVVSFIIKTCVVSAVVTGCTIFAADWIVEKVEYSVSRTITNIQQGTIGGRKFWAKVEEELDRAAAPTSDMSPERKQKLINDVRIIVARWRPLIDALQDSKQGPAAVTSETGK
jgi:hypothetical protein